MLDYTKNTSGVREELRKYLLAERLKEEVNLLLNFLKGETENDGLKSFKGNFTRS